MPRPLLLLAFLTLSRFSQAQSSLTIKLVYDNSQLTPITFTKVLLKANGITIDSANTGISGQVNFYNLTAGTYQCIPVCTKVWGGGNSCDAMLICRNFVHDNNFYLTGIRLKAAAVKRIGSVPGSLDELYVIRRFLKVIPHFMPPGVNPGTPDWTYELFYIMIEPGSGNINRQIKMLCTGDCNGSYIPY